MAPKGSTDVGVSPKASKVVAGDGATVAAAGKGKYTWQDVAAHNTANSAWVIIEGQVYDITQFLDRHPGGSEMLLLAAGRECTDLYNSYHALATKDTRKYLDAYHIGALVGKTEFPVFANDTAGFYATLSKRVRAHFDETGKDPKGMWPGAWRLALILSIALTCYAIVNGLLLPELPYSAKVVAAVVFGIFQAMPLLHAMHDASHAAIGHSQTSWRFFGRLCLDFFAGSCMLSWHHQHVVGHHVYTNVFQADPDIPGAAEGDPRRILPAQRWKSLYRWQHIYLPIVYGILGLRSRVQDITDTYWARSSGNIRVNAYDHWLHRIVLTKALWATWRILVPLFVLGVPARTFWTLFFISEFATGYWLAWNFEVSHLSDECTFPGAGGADVPIKDLVGKAAPSGKAPAKPIAAGAADPVSVVADSWAVNQVKTSVDYGHNSWLTAFFSGALNYQIEHHLFPGVSQYHYPAIAPIVMKTCQEFGVPYRLEPDFPTAWAAHLRLLRTMGEKGIPYKFD